MTREEQHEPTVKLDQVVDTLRELPLPEGPEDSFRRQLVAQLVSGDHDVSPAKPNHANRRLTMRQVFGITASTLIAGAVVGWLVLTNGQPARGAFAEMLRAVDSARTVTFTTHAEVRGAGEKFQVKTMIFKPDWVREEVSGGHVIICNMREQKSLSLSPEAKKAILRDMAKVPARYRKTIVEQISELRESSAEFLGKEQIDGVETLKYRAAHPTGHYLMWLTAEDHLPVKVVMSETGDKAVGYVTATLTDFEWNVPLDKSLFTLEVPEGYDLEKEEAKPSSGPEHFIATLKAYVRLNDNTFPDEFNALTPGSMVKFLDDPTLAPEERKANYRRKLAEAMDIPDAEKLEKLSDEEWKKVGRRIGRTLAQGAGFLQSIGLTHEWHYVGKGAKLGDADRIVAWWAPKPATEEADGDKAGTATVLYGDFHMETKPINGLPGEE